MNLNRVIHGGSQRHNNSCGQVLMPPRLTGLHGVFKLLYHEHAGYRCQSLTTWALIPDLRIVN